MLALLIGAAVGCTEHGLNGDSIRALREVRSVLEALDQYQQDCGGYPDTLQRLQPSAGITDRCRAHPALAGQDLDALRKSPGGKREYWYTYTPSSVVAERAPAVYRRFELSATWPDPDEEHLSVWSTEAGAIHHARGRAAGKSDPTLK